jgi:hypothetical protein
MTIVPRSRLYRLDPAGFGTAFVESLTSFIMRLAAAHHLTPGQLVRTSLTALMRSSRGADLQIGEIELTAAFANGVRSGARMWLRAIEEATTHDDLARLTALPWARVLSGYHLLRETMAHCPLCLEEMAEAGLVYEPLLWAIRLVTVCPKHERVLELACRQCGRTQAAFRWNGRPGICVKCRVWLGGADASLVTAARNELQVSQAIASMLAAPPRPEVDPELIGSALEAGMADLGVTQSAFALAAGVAVPSVSAWRRGLGKIGLPGIVAMCAVGGWDVPAFLDGRVVTVVDGPAPMSSPLRRRHLFDWDFVRQRLVEHGGDEPPITQVRLAAELGVTVGWLRKQLPGETQVLIDRRHEWEIARAKARIEMLLALVVSTTLRLLESGRKASAREVECHFPSNVSLQEPRLMNAWRQTRLEWQLARDETRSKAA